MLETLFSESVRQFGLPVGLLLVAVVVLARVVYVQHRETKASYEKRIAELEIERNLYRDRWLNAVDTAEVGEEAAARLTRGRRRG